MFDFYEKRKIRGIVYSWISVVILFTLALFMSMSAYGRFAVERETNQKLEVRESDLEALRERAAALEAKVEHLKNDRGLEEELRKRFDIAREGEQIVIIIDDETEDTENITNTSTLSPKGDTHPWYEVFKFW